MSAIVGSNHSATLSAQHLLESGGGALQTQVLNPQSVFNMPQRLVVPLFQRPYVWNEDNQWRPLWEDVERLTEKMLAGDYEARHFLGAVVLQQQPNLAGTLMTRTIIDGQQRLTTLQLLFDAIFAELTKRGLDSIARRMTDLTQNPEHQRRELEDRFKVWPTNRDRDAYSVVMSEPTPIYESLAQSRERVVKAHEFFAKQVDDWLRGMEAEVTQRASTLVDCVATQLQLVVIDLQQDEDAQEIFETLNARGTPLTAADLIKNLVFQRLNLPPEEAEKTYHELWEHFETPFWEKEVSSGRVLWSRSSLFLAQWLIAQRREEITAREAFSTFKRFLEESEKSIIELLRDIKGCASVYEALHEASSERHTPLSPLEMFTYRAREMQSEITRPVVIWLSDPSLPEIPFEQLEKAISCLESWLVRRTLIREKSQGTNKFLIDLLAELVDGDRQAVGDRMEAILSRQSSVVSYWPDDEMVRSALSDMPIYRKLSRGRLRMVLEAVEDHKRGFPASHKMGEQPVVREECTIEHVLPQKWIRNWSSEDLNENQVRARDALVHTLGNLTLVSKTLNPSLSNSAWSGEDGKRAGLSQYSSIKMTAEVIALADHDPKCSWTDELIEERTEQLIDEIIDIWPVPRGHAVDAVGVRASSGEGVTLKDMLDADVIQEGTRLVSSLPKYRIGERAVATLLGDGRLIVQDQEFKTPSGAGKFVAGRNVNGWTFWQVESNEGLKLRELQRRVQPFDASNAVGPFSASDLENWDSTEDSGLDELVNLVTQEMFSDSKLLPLQIDRGELRIGRFVSSHVDQPNPCVGIPRQAHSVRPEVPIWVRYTPDTPSFDNARRNLLGSRSDVWFDSATGHMWIPLEISEELRNQDLVQDLVDQIRVIDMTARQTATASEGGA